jgi:hypothetical protein
MTNPGTFLASEEPTNHPKVRQLFFECALSKQASKQAPPPPGTTGAVKRGGGGGGVGGDFIL